LKLDIRLKVNKIQNWKSNLEFRYQFVKGLHTPYICIDQQKQEQSAQNSQGGNSSRNSKNASSEIHVQALFVVCSSLYSIQHAQRRYHQIISLLYLKPWLKKTYETPYFKMRFPSGEAKPPPSYIKPYTNLNDCLQKNLSIL